MRSALWGQGLTDRDGEFYENKCATLDQQIDAPVYQHYGLTADEIKLVEGVMAMEPLEFTQYFRMEAAPNSRVYSRIALCKS